MPALSTQRSRRWKRPASRSPRSSSCTLMIASMRSSAERPKPRQPLVSRAAAAGARKLADLRWRGGIVAGNDVDEETAAKLRRALNRAIAWLRENEDRSRDQVL